MEFLDKLNILYKSQSGFQKNHYTDFCVSYLTDEISKDFDSSLLTGVILIDLQKTFDTIDHNVLLLKMPSLGFSSEVIDWYKSYLSKLAWYPNLNKRLKRKLQTVQNRCIRYCLQLDKRSQVRVKKITGSPSLKDLISTFVLRFLFFFRKLVLYIFMIYRQSGQNWANTRSSVLKLKHPLRNTCSVQKKLLYLTPTVRNSLPTDLKLPNSLNNFKHKLKDHFFKKLRNMEQNVFAYWRRIRNLNSNIFN